MTSGCLLLYLSSLGHFLIFRVKSPIALLQSVFFFTVTLMQVSLYFLILFEKSKLSALMDDLAEVLGKSKLKLFLRSESKFITFEWWLKWWQIDQNSSQLKIYHSHSLFHHITGSIKPTLRLLYSEEVEKSEKFAKKIMKWLFIFLLVTAVLKVFETYHRFYVLHDGAAPYKPLMPAT